MSTENKVENGQEFSRYFDVLRGSFWDYVSDMYALPDSLEFRLPPTGIAGFYQDAEAIGSYFQTVLGHEESLDSTLINDER